MKATFVRFWAAAVIGLLGAPDAPAQLTVLHSFGSGAGNGVNPWGSPALAGSTVYGMTQGGGANGLGTVFRLDADGTGFLLRHSFAGQPDDGSSPFGSLAVSGSMLYGLTYDGGEFDRGTVFRVGADGTGYAVLHSFGKEADDGRYPVGSLALSGSTLYGMTSEGGTEGSGTVFRVETGGGYAKLHDFGSAGDGSRPSGALVATASTLYGMTEYGGAHNQGSVFSISADGADYTVRHSFSGGGSDDGSLPLGSLTPLGTTLYGMTSAGGAHDRGAVFQMDSENNSVVLLHSFGGAGDGEIPHGSLAVSEDRLYGMTRDGGAHDFGTIFALDADGGNYGLLHSFAGGDSDGGSPRGDVVVADSVLYGLTYAGGANNAGTVFSFAIPEPLSAVLLLLSGGLLAVRRRLRAAASRA